MGYLHGSRKEKLDPVEGLVAPLEEVTSGKSILGRTRQTTLARHYTSRVDDRECSYSATGGDWRNCHRSYATIPYPLTHTDNV